MKKLYEKKTSFDKEKRRRFTHRKNQYEDTGVDKEYKYQRTQIKRGKEDTLRSTRKKLIRTSNEIGARKQVGENTVLQGNAPTKEERNLFFKLLKCNMIAITNAFGNDEEIYYRIEAKGKKLCVTVNQKELGHLIGMSTVLGERSQLAVIVGNWSIRNPIEKINGLINKRHEITSLENKIGMILNYTKGREKNKSLFLFDLFNSQKKQVFVRQMNQQEVDTVYEKELGKTKKQENNDYIVMEREKRIKGDKRRFITILFKFVPSQDRYMPVSIMETGERKLDDNNTAVIEQIDKSEYLRIKHMNDSRRLNAQDINDATRDRITDVEGRQRMQSFMGSIVVDNREQQPN